jgi:plasmid maintenance system antidote protein VapI
MATETKRRKKISSTQLQHIESDVRDIVNHYMEKNKLTVHGFAKLCQIHPNQLYLFLDGKRGLTLATVQRMGEIIEKELK